MTEHRRLPPRAEPGRLHRDVVFLAETAAPRFASHPEVLDRAARHLADGLAAAGARVADQPYAAGGATYRNVIGSLGPADGPFVVVGAHYDAYGGNGANPGADDNASGAAGVVELARLLALSPLEIRVELVAFSTEEPPFFATAEMGSAVHARSLAGGPLPEAMLCLEMIGFFSETQPWPAGLVGLPHPGHGRFISIAGRPEDAALVARVDAAYRALGAIESLPYSGPWFEEVGFSDHRNYWPLGVSAVMIGDTAFLRNPHYHRATDTADTLDYPRMAAVVDGVAALLAGWPG